MTGKLRALARPGVVAYRHLGLVSDDLVVASFPKSGSTWLRFVLAAALTGQEMDYDLVQQVSPPLGAHRGAAGILSGGGRLVKSHDRPRFVGSRSSRPRVLCLVRDGRDVAVSYHHHLKRRGLADEDFAPYFDAFLAGRAGVFGSWHGWVRSWLDAAERLPELMTIKYEDVLADPDGTVHTISTRFGLGLTGSEIGAALAGSTPEGMRAKEASSKVLEKRVAGTTTSFVRKARAGGWREALTVEQQTRFDAVAGRELIALGYPLSTNGA